jgi:hypothetical protein
VAGDGRRDRLRTLQVDCVPASSLSYSTVPLQVLV